MWCAARHVDAVMEPTKGEQKLLIEEMKGRMAQDDSTVPMPDGPYAYFSRFVTGGEYPIRSRISREDFESGKWTADGPALASQQDLLDGNELGKGQEFFKLGSIEHSEISSAQAPVPDFFALGSKPKPSPKPNLNPNPNPRVRGCITES